MYLFIAGIGDAVLLIPMVKYLKSQQFNVVGLVTSRYPCEEIFELTDIFDDIIVAKTIRQKLLFFIQHAFKFDMIYLNYFAGKYTNIFFARVLARNIITNSNVIRYEWLKMGYFKIIEYKVYSTSRKYS